MIRLGLDVGGSKIHAVAFDRDLEAVAEIRTRTEAAYGHPDQRVADQVVSVVDRLWAAVERVPLDGVGIGIPGVVDAASGRVRAAVNLGIGAEPLDLGRQVAETFNVRCRVDNDVNVAALGARQLVDPDLADLIYLSIGTGLAAGVVLNGRLRRGHAGVAGEIGHLPVVGTGPRCRCGLDGCLEVMASGHAMARLWPTTPGNSPARALIAAAATGDPDAVAVRQQIGHWLATAVYLLTVTYDVAQVVIGGGVADIGRPLLTMMADGVAELADRSELVRSLALMDRVSLKPDGPVAAVGAALLLAEDVGR